MSFHTLETELTVTNLEYPFIDIETTLEATLEITKSVIDDVFLVHRRAVANPKQVTDEIALELNHACMIDLLSALRKLEGVQTLIRSARRTAGEALSLYSGVPYED